MLIPFLMIWTGKESDDFGRSPFSIRDVANRHFQSEMLPIERSSKKKPSWDRFLLEIFHVKQKMHFFGGPTLPPSGPVL